MANWQLPIQPHRAETFWLLRAIAGTPGMMKRSYVFETQAPQSRYLTITSVNNH